MSQAPPPALPIPASAAAVYVPGPDPQKNFYSSIRRVCDILTPLISHKHIKTNFISFPMSLSEIWVLNMRLHFICKKCALALLLRLFHSNQVLKSGAEKVWLWHFFLRKLRKVFFINLIILSTDTHEWFLPANAIRWRWRWLVFRKNWFADKCIASI